MDWLQYVQARRSGSRPVAPSTDPVTVRAQADGSVSLRIVGPIDWWFGVDVIEGAQQLLRDRPSAVDVYIDSPGGDLFDALALRAALDTLVADGTSVTVQAGAVVASAAVPVYLAGTERKAQAYTRFMVHAPRAHFFGMGTLVSLPEAFENFLTTLTAGTELYWSTLASHVAQASVDTWAAADKDTWLTVAEAQEHGVVTAVVEAVEPEGPTAVMADEVQLTVKVSVTMEEEEEVSSHVKAILRAMDQGGLRRNHTLEVSR